MNFNQLIFNNLVILMLSFIDTTNSNDKETKILSRHKRYVVFPEGSSLTVAFCITMNILGIPHSIFTELINFGINYDLPNRTGYEFQNFAEPKQLVQRRHRRALYNKMEIILNAMGFDGRACVYRALCETARELFSTGGNVAEELIRRIFSFPLDQLFNSEPEEHRLFHRAYRMGRENRDCQKLFSNCGTSLIESLLGYRNHEPDPDNM